MTTTIRFNVFIGEDRLIRVPENVRPGEAEVILVQKQPETQGLRAMIDGLAQAAAEEGVHGLPSDMAENHDCYAHGGPRKED